GWMWPVVFWCPQKSSDWRRADFGLIGWTLEVPYPTKTEGQIFEIQLRTTVCGDSENQSVTRSSLANAGTQLRRPRSHAILINHARRLLQSLVRAIRMPEIRFGCFLAEGHPAWNITDEVNLPDHSECRYILELLYGQSVAIELDSATSLEVFVCEDDDYDS